MNADLCSTIPRTSTTPAAASRQFVQNASSRSNATNLPRPISSPSPLVAHIVNRRALGSRIPRLHGGPAFLPIIIWLHAFTLFKAPRLTIIQRPDMHKSISSQSEPSRRKSFSHDSPNVITTGSSSLLRSQRSNSLVQIRFGQTGRSGLRLSKRLSREEQIVVSLCAKWVTV